MVFKVDSHNKYTDNSLLKLLEEEIIPQINRDSLCLRRLIVRGAASPEGATFTNELLGRRRSEELSLFLRARLHIPADEKSYATEVVTEDFGLLSLMMERAGDPDADTVRSLYNQYPTKGERPILKRKLQQVQGGRLWYHLYRNYFPELRAARMILVLGKPAIAPLDLKDLKDLKAPEDFTRHPILSTDSIKPLEPIESFSPIQPQALPETKIPRRELMSVKTNLLLYGFYLPGGYDRWCPIPNVAIEFYPLRGHFTYGASIDFPWWQSYNKFKFFEVRNYQLEARYYFRSGNIKRNAPGKGAAFRGWYLQGYANVGLFDICFDKDTGYDGEYLGGGIGAGYVLPLTKKGHWRLEFSLQAGYVYGKHDPYQFENLINPDYHDKLYYYRWTGKPSDFKLRQYRFSWLGPTRVGITLSYDLLYRRVQKKGISFRNWEKTRPTTNGTTE